METKSAVNSWSGHGQRPLFLVQAKIYLSMEQAQKMLLPGKSLTKSPILITEDLQDKMRSASSIRHPFQGDRIWKASEVAGY